MENITKPETLDETLAAIVALKSKVEQAFNSMGEAMLKLAAEQKTIAETLNQVIADRNEQLALVGRLLEQIQALTKLQDSDHAQLEVLMAPNGRLKATDVN